MSTQYRCGEVGDFYFYVSPTWEQPFRGQELFTYGTHDKPANEYFSTIEEAMVAAIAAKYTGERGAAGSGVGTAGDWFLKMIGVKDNGFKRD